MGEARTLQLQLLEEMPDLKDRVEGEYREARDRNSRLLGHLRAVEEALAALTSTMRSSLRAWQRRCINAALEHYSATPHFFCQATPGAGKTRMAAELARSLLQQGKIDLVLCFAPSCQGCRWFSDNLLQVLGQRLDGLIGAVGDVCTYQGMEHRAEAFWFSR